VDDVSKEHFFKLDLQMYIIYFISRSKLIVCCEKSSAPPFDKDMTTPDYRDPFGSRQLELT
jgi:hypothetical protein